MGAGRAERASVVFLSAILWVGAAQAASPQIYASTNLGELVVLDLDLATAVLVGRATAPAGRPAEWGWSDLAMSATGELFAVSRALYEIDLGQCAGNLSDGPCAHLYRVDPATGAVLAEVGSLGIAFVSDIEFAADGVLYVSRWVHEDDVGAGGLATVDPSTAASTVAANPSFGPNPFDPGSELANGALGIDPLNGEFWGVESNYANVKTMFRIDPSTGRAFNLQRITLFGVPSSFGLHALIILPDGRFIASAGQAAFDLFEIDPISTSLTRLPFDVDPDIVGMLSGLTGVPPFPERLEDRRSTPALEVQAPQPDGGGGPGGGGSTADSQGCSCSARGGASASAWRAVLFVPFGLALALGRRRAACGLRA
jgi:hypothetical protein